VRVGDVYLQLFFVRTQLKRNHCIIIAGTCYYYFILCVWCGGLVNDDDDDDDIITFGSKISNSRPRLKHRFPQYDIILYYIQKWDGLANDKKIIIQNIYGPRLFRTTTLSGLVIQADTDNNLLQ